METPSEYERAVETLFCDQEHQSSMYDNTWIIVKNLRTVILHDHAEECAKIEEQRKEKEENERKAVLLKTKELEERRRANYKNGMKFLIPIINNRPYEWGEHIKKEQFDRVGLLDDELDVSVEMLLSGMLNNAFVDLPNSERDLSGFKSALYAGYVEAAPFEICRVGKNNRKLWHFFVSFKWKV
jgi:hypothetical protein